VNEAVSAAILGLENEASGVSLSVKIYFAPSVFSSLSLVNQKDKMGGALQRAGRLIFVITTHCP
jgi:hypothetical protein